MVFGICRFWKKFQNSQKKTVSTHLYKCIKTAKVVASECELTVSQAAITVDTLYAVCKIKIDDLGDWQICFAVLKTSQKISYHGIVGIMMWYWVTEGVQIRWYHRHETWKHKFDVSYRAFSGSCKVTCVWVVHMKNCSCWFLMVGKQLGLPTEC